MRPLLHRLVQPVLLAGALLATTACETSAPVDPTKDTRRPTIIFAAAPDAMTDSTIGWSATLTDNVGLHRVTFTLRGGLIDTIPVRFTANETNRTIQPVYALPAGTPTGTRITIHGAVRDGAGNTTQSEGFEVIVGLSRAPSVTLLQPARSNTSAVQGRSIAISVVGQTGVRVRTLGYTLRGVLTDSDSSVNLSPLPDSTAFTDTLSIPATADTGVVTITPFLVDSLSQRTVGKPVRVRITSPAARTTPPMVRFGVTPRIEAGDTVQVRATDPTGIRLLGYEVRDALTGALLRADSTSTGGSLIQQQLALRLNLSRLRAPRRLWVSAFATNGNGIRARAALETGAVRQDTVLLVEGKTSVLPVGGEVADAIFHPRLNQLYLRNVTKNRLEVFSLGDSSFKSGIAVGSRPWGLAGWPRNRQGEFGDTILVANSGGTTVSYVDVRRGREVHRYPLPNLLLYTVKTVQGGGTGGSIQQRTLYDFRDRPQFIATTCRSTGTTCRDVLLVYRTTPTFGQATPFTNRGSARWENLRTQQSHFFFEHAIGQDEGQADTIEVVRLAAQGVGADSVLVPYRQIATNPANPTDADTVSYTIRLNAVGFRDTTYVRNSGDFRRTIFGEGGDVANRRTLMYDATRGFLTRRPRGFPLPIPAIDHGVSRPGDVTDFIANTRTRVRGVSINFDGSLSGVRADSTYLIDPTLRLQGLLQTSGVNAGFDFHPQNTGYNSTPLSTRLAFAASKDAAIEVYDTWCYAKVAEVPVRDPILGPIKAAATADGTLVLVGATKHGVVMVGLRTPPTTTCQ